MRLFLTLALIALTASLPAQQPQIVHAQLTTQAAERGLAAEIQQLEKSSATVWIGYSVATVQSFHSGWNGGHTSYLEGSNTYSSNSTDDQHGATNRANILLRISGGRIDKLRAESPEQTLDAGDQRFVWLTNVTAEDSIAELRSIATSNENRKQLDSAVFLISVHDAPAALPALISLTNASHDLNVRDKAAFWLANGRGHEGFVAIQQLARTDKDDRLRDKLTFDLTLSKDPAAVDELIRMAHEDASPKVRSQAQFWMAQTAKKRDEAKISASLRGFAENDPDVQTRRQAVFAVSQLPGDRAVTELTDLANNSKHPEVREQAVFWLGQSKDPRALEYLTKLLK